MKYENALLEKSLHFAARIVKLYQYLSKEKNESIISKQIIRSGTSIGANANEAVYGVSQADFIAKLQISLKETVETECMVAIIAFNRIFRWKASKIINWRLFGNQTDSDIFFENREEWKDLIRVHYPQRFLENTSFLLILARNDNPVTKVAGFLLFVPIDLSRYKW